jgi:hypothetical protein
LEPNRLYLLGLAALWITTAVSGKRATKNQTKHAFPVFCAAKYASH